MVACHCLELLSMPKQSTAVSQATACKEMTQGFVNQMASGEALLQSVLVGLT